MGRITQLGSRLEGVGHVLSDNFLAVPKYQRSYAWEPQSVNELITDVHDAMNSKQEEYFLGAIVTGKNRRDEKVEVIDGQQRLATTAILLAAIRDFFLSAGDEEGAVGIEQAFLFKRNLRSRELVPRIALNAYDHKFFLQTVLERSPATGGGTPPTRESHERIKAAKKCAKDFLIALAKTAKDPKTPILDLVEYFAESAMVIRVEVPDHANAFLIFETLNDRGLDLSISDLLKNYLFGTAGDRIDEVEQRWMAMLAALETAENESIVPTYLRHLWASFHGPTREKELYEKIRKKINSKQAAVDFSDTLAENAKRYAALLNPSHEIWEGMGGSAKRYMETLVHLRLEQFRPLLLAVLESFGTRDIEETLRCLVSASVRFLVSGGLGSGTIERVYSEIPPALRSRKIGSVAALVAELSKHVPPDSQFKDDFTRARVSQAYLARYYLWTLERAARKDSQPELIPNPNEREINLEHVLPETPSAAWGHIDPEHAKLLHKRIGNLALMKERLNARIGNKGFSEKKKFYAKSKLMLTKEISQEKTWGLPEIDSRQRRLADLAVKVWRL